MSRILLRNGMVVTEEGAERGSVLVTDGRIGEIYLGGDAPTGLSAGEVVDLSGDVLAPGMIDIHIHGSAGVDVLQADHEGLAKLSEFLLAAGVTGYFATLVPTGDREYEEALERIYSYREEAGPRQARILGVHFEGPFVSHHKCGALQRQHFRIYDGDPRSIEVFTGGGSLPTEAAHLITLAPEVEGGLKLTGDLAARGVRVFIGHTQAEPETLDHAAEVGARHITHFPNALDPLHHRKPGAVAWGLVRGDITVDCIADFHHVHPLMLRMIYQAKSSDRVALISDSIPPAGLGDGEFTVWGDKIAVRDGKTALTEGPAAGTIAGSVITMRDALKNTLSLGVPLHEAVRMASLVPARAAGIERRRGSIKEGKQADLVVFDKDLNVRLAVTNGAIALRA